MGALALGGYGHGVRALRILREGMAAFASTGSGKAGKVFVGNAISRLEISDVVALRASRMSAVDWITSRLTFA